ncbi:glycosyltransferase 87 family protein [Knoellia sp. p5-6-4]|uniref:glycosyltransferase 87 family protein n=1 Tax=unclassified Knoellia TaxID=2618719 RepID=UPI0023DBA7E9|nr:glycosyltransferase 87 family protein [Knoellia sp. p5-6-4]MDF2146422.1 glycosyltransferase 87 family protein [Knoellia sp. p5-6-4]
MPTQQAGTWSGAVSPRGGRQVSVRYLGATATALGASWIGWRYGRNGGWFDLDVYIRGAQALVRGEDLYNVSVHGLPFTYPPFAALLFVPVGSLSPWLLEAIFTAGSLASYAFVLALLGTRLGLRSLDVALVGLVGLALEPIRFNITLGQINLYLMFLVVLDSLLVPKRHRGWLVGLAAGIKLVPGVFLLFFLVKRDWASAIRFGGAFLGTVIAGFIVAPRASLDYWLGAFVNLNRWGEGTVAGVWNQSLNGVWTRHVGSGWGGGLAALMLLGCIGLGLSVALALRASRLGDDVGATLALALGGLLASPISWTHHWVWICPVLLFLKANRLYGSLIVGAAVFWFGPFKLADSEATDLNLMQQLAAATYVVFGVCLLLRLLVPHSDPSEGAGGVHIRRQILWVRRSAAARLRRLIPGRSRFMRPAVTSDQGPLQ